MQANYYQVSGDRQGQVTVRDTTSGEVIRTFWMDEGVDDDRFWDENNLLKVNVEGSKLKYEDYPGGSGNSEVVFLTFATPHISLILHK